MKRWKNPRAVWASAAAGLVLFAGIFPYSHDAYIAPMFTAVCICLNAASAVLFAMMLYLAVARRFSREFYGMFAGALVLQGVGHAVFALMNWGSWLCLGLTAVALAAMAVSWYRGR